MPFLRFTRDKRGYETTLLVHSGRRDGRSRQRILYWFRTPPGVRVGRPALDAEAIRWIEEHNPDIEFDWPKILASQPPAAPPANETRTRKGRRDPERPRPARSARPLPPPPPQRQPELSERVPSEPAPAETEPSEPEIAQAFEQLTHPETEETADPVVMPLDQRVGPEQLTRLRARYSEVLARIAERGGEIERVEALRAQAELLNPDTWLTDEDVRQGVESFEPRIRDLRAALGLRRRRRSRRGGKRRRAGDGGAPPTEEPGSSSNEGE